MEDDIIVSKMTKVREKRIHFEIKRPRDNERRLLTADGCNQMLVILVRFDNNKSACIGVRARPRLVCARRCFSGLLTRAWVGAP
jgi:hypothetical protein